MLSTGGIAPTFVEDLLLMPEAEVLAVGSRTTEAAQAFAQRYGIARAYGDWETLAADEDLESPLVPHATTLEVMSLLDEVRAQVGARYPTC